MRIAICDDDLLEQQRFADYLSTVAKKNNLKFTYDFFKSGDQLLFEYSEPKSHADIVFLDINMPGTNGIKTSQALRRLGYCNLIVFLTAVKTTDSYCNAFDIDAFHYIVKNTYSSEKVEEIVLKAVSAAAQSKKNYFLFECAGDTRNIDVESIRYFDILHRIVTVHYGKDEAFDFYSQLEKVEEAMEPYGFMRVHRSFIASLDYIKTVSAEKLVLFDGTALPVSRRAYQDLKTRMKDRRKPLNDT